MPILKGDKLLGKNTCPRLTRLLRGIIGVFWVRAAQISRRFAQVSENLRARSCLLNPKTLASV